jgi:hypothetical protein
VRGDIIIIQDADLGDRTTRFRAHSGKRARVFGNRFHGGAHRVLYFWRYVASKALTLATNMLTNLNLSTWRSVFAPTWCGGR